MSSPLHVDPKRPLFIGDTHADTEWWLRHVLPLARRFRADLLIQLGDFGVWPGEFGVRYLDVLEKNLAEMNLTVLFVDGNHEDFTQLEALEKDESGLAPLRPHIFHIPRGTRWTWFGKQFLALGGAYSIDKDIRTPFISWWPQETITYRQALEAIDAGPCDVLLCHDVPLEVPFEDFYPLPETYSNRRTLQEVVDATRPQLILHGHMHRAYRTITKGRLYLGLDCNGKSGNLVLLDTDLLLQGASLNKSLIPIDNGPRRAGVLDEGSLSI